MTTAMRSEDLEYLFSFPVDRVDQECRAADAPKRCDGYDNRNKLIVFRALMPLTDGATMEAILCAKHMEELQEALADLMDKGVAKARREGLI